MPRFFDEQGNEVDPYSIPDDDDGTGYQEPPPTTQNPLRAQINRQTRKIRELENKVAEGDKAVRKLAFIEAGIDMDNPMAPYFVDGFQGDVTPEAIKAKAAEANLLKPTAQPGQQQQGQPQMQQQPGQQYAPQQQPQLAQPAQQQPGFQLAPPGTDPVQAQFQQAQNAFRAIQGAQDANMPGTRNYDAEMRAAAAAGRQGEVDRILAEKHAATGPHGVPAIVND